jgi:hypothetical protein
MCDFPARQLVRHAYKHAKVTNNYSAQEFTYAYGLIKLAIETGKFHEDLTGCDCMQEALREVGLGKEKPTGMDRAEPPALPDRKRPATVRHCTLCYRTIAVGDMCDDCQKNYRARGY